MSIDFAVGIDLGATKIAAALVTHQGEVVAHQVLPTRPERGEMPVLQDIARLVRKMQAAAREHDGRLLGVGVGSPGQIDTRQGSISNAVNLGWEHVDLVRDMCNLLDDGTPVWLQKDANAAALGEFYFGAARSEPDFLYFSIGSGLGGSAVSDGRLILGAYGNAAEVGHISIDPQSKRICECGQPGCSETTISGPGLQSLLRELLLQQKEDTRLNGDAEPVEIVAAARQGDAVALSALQIMSQHLGIVMSHAVTWFNPGLVVLGGGLGLAAFDLIVPSCLAEARKRTYRGNMGFRMVPSSVESSAVGAASMVWYSLNGGIDR